MNKERFFRVKYGFNKADQVCIPESEVERAIYAQIKGTPMQLGNAFVKGSNIISITPNYHKHTGWNEWYEPVSGDDWMQIKRDCPNYDGILEHYKDRIQYLMSNNQEKLIGKGVDIPSLMSPVENKVIQQRSEDGLRKIGESSFKLSFD